MAAEQFVEESILTLLSSPGPISIPRLPFGRGGPGPIDVFSSRFANLFTDDVAASFNGESIDRNGLKEKLVALKKKFDPSSASFDDDGSSSSNANDVHTKLQWNALSSQGESGTADNKLDEVIWDAKTVIINEEGFRRINKVGIKTQILSN